MRVSATLKLDSGDEIRVEVNPEDLDDEEILVRWTAGDSPSKLADHLVS